MDDSESEGEGAGEEVGEGRADSPVGEESVAVRGAGRPSASGSSAFETAAFGLSALEPSASGLLGTDESGPDDSRLRADVLGDDAEGISPGTSSAGSAGWVGRLVVAFVRSAPA